MKLSLMYDTMWYLSSKRTIILASNKIEMGVC
jgi:hypothetical protein